MDATQLSCRMWSVDVVCKSHLQHTQMDATQFSCHRCDVVSKYDFNNMQMYVIQLPLSVECMVNIYIIVESHSRGMYAREQISKA
jgi:hypothetical protein